MHQVVRALNPRAGSSGSLCPPGSFAGHPGPWPAVSYPDWSASVVWQLPWLSRSAFSAGVCGLKGLLLAALWSTLSLKEQIPHPSLSVGLPCPDSRQVSCIRATESLQPRVPPPHVITGVAEAGENDLPKAKELLKAKQACAPVSTRSGRWLCPMDRRRSSAWRGGCRMACPALLE